MKCNVRLADYRALQPAVVALVFTLVGALVILGYRHLPLNIDNRQEGDSVPYMYPDSDHYLAIANGHLAQVSSPYSRRILYPWMAGALSRAFHVPAEAAFMTLNYFGFVTIGYGLAFVLRELKVSPWWALFPCLLPWPLEFLQRAMLPDLFDIVMLTFFFLLLIRGWNIAALVVLFLAFLTRENTILLCLVIAGLAWFQGKRDLLWGSLIVLLLGLASDSWLVRQGQPNAHHLPEIVYTALALPCSFLGNIFGINIWTNTNESMGAYFYVWTIPQPLVFGTDRLVYVGYKGIRCFDTFSNLLTMFGTAFMAYCFIRRASGPVRTWVLAVQVAFAYGIISYFLGTTLGRTGTERLIAYGWPLFWIAFPYAWTRAGLSVTRLEKIFLLCAGVAIAWLPELSGLNDLARQITFWMLGIPLLYVASAVCLSRIVARNASVPIQAAAR